MSRCPLANVPEQNSDARVPLNGGILPMDDRSKMGGALAIRNGRRLAPADNAVILSPAGSRMRTIELGGKMVAPGLIDTHTHFKAAGMSDDVAGAFSKRISKPKRRPLS